jgi:hypothetical protein
MNFERGSNPLVSMRIGKIAKIEMALKKINIDINEVEIEEDFTIKNKEELGGGIVRRDAFLMIQLEFMPQNKRDFYMNLLNNFTGKYDPNRNLLFEENIKKALNNGVSEKDAEWIIGLWMDPFTNSNKEEVKLYFKKIMEINKENSLNENNKRIS